MLRLVAEAQRVRLAHLFEPVLAVHTSLVDPLPHQIGTSDLIRRMVKENLLKFASTPLFPERIACALPYKFSSLETRLYKEVTDSK